MRGGGLPEGESAPRVTKRRTTARISATPKCGLDIYNIKYILRRILCAAVDTQYI